VPSDHCLLASVSNWGGYGLAAAIGLRYAHENQTAITAACLPTPEGEQRLAEALAAGGVRDGVNGRAADESLDGLPWEVNQSFLAELRRGLLLGDEG